MKIIEKIGLLKKQMKELDASKTGQLIQDGRIDKAIERRKEAIKHLKEENIAWTKITNLYGFNYFTYRYDNGNI